MRIACFLLLAACGGTQGARPAPTPAPTTSAEKERQQPPTPIETRPAPPPPEVEKAPPPAHSWGDPVARATVPKVYLKEQAKAENKATCPLLVLTDLGDGAGAKLRRANFGGGWAVAYDKPGQRSAFGIAGTGVEADGKGPEWPNQMIWDDGSSAGYGPEGGTGPKLLAYVTVKGAGCLYNVWSALGQEHLELLLRGARRVAD